MPALLQALPAKAAHPLQADSLRSLQTLGLPNKKHEAWRFTSVASLVDQALKPGEVVWQIEGDASLARKVTMDELSNVADFGSTLPNRYFAALNTALLRDALWVRVPKGQRAELRLAPSGAADQAIYPRVFVELGELAELTLVEDVCGGAALTAPITEVVAQRGAQLQHVRLHRGEQPVLGALGVRQHANTSLQTTSFTTSLGLVRMDLSVRLEGAGAEARTAGAFLSKGSAHVDHHVLVEHAHAHCTSHQDFRGVLTGRATGVFDGQAHIRPNASHSEAHQSSRTILLSERATMHTKPHLEIENDDVVASHGATVGALDTDQLFYLQSRGVPSELAERILVGGFVREIVESISADSKLGDAVRTELLQQLESTLENFQR